MWALWGVASAPLGPAGPLPEEVGANTESCCGMGDRNPQPRRNGLRSRRLTVR